jgi:transcriptional regulator with XRE-family HTH domain
MVDNQLAERLGRNIRQLREARGVTQHQIAKLAALPRATWANLESGTANPTLSVLNRVAAAFQVSLEELIAVPRAACEHYPAATLPIQKRGEAIVRKLLPHPIPGMELDRIEIPAGGRMVGVPHTPGTREYLTCEEGEIQLVAAGETYLLAPGDVVTFRGDQRHSYNNVGRKVAIGYSVVLMARDA